MDYRLQVFSRVAEQQSISAAARTLRISQPAVTQHIKFLENSFQTTLFIRSRNGVTLTETGAILLAHSRRVSELSEEVTEKIRRKDSPLQGRIRLGASTTIAGYFLPEILVAFKKAHPCVEVEITGGNSNAMINALLSQRIDVGLIESPCDRHDLKKTKFFEDEIVVIVSAKHPLAFKKSTSLKQLLQYPVVLREEGSGTRQCIERSLKQNNILPSHLKIIQELPNTEAIKRVVATGIGIGFISKTCLPYQDTNSSLKTIAIRGVEIRRFFSIILPLGPDPKGIRQIFLKFLQR
ncbi:MAG: LysR family transcriptional regulator [Chthoniobacterales bacterium]